MDKVVANIAVIGAEALLRHKFEGSSVNICAGIYDNHPMELAYRLLKGKPVKFALTISDEEIAYRYFIIDEHNDVRVVSMSKDTEGAVPDTTLTRIGMGTFGEVEEHINGILEVQKNWNY